MNISNVVVVVSARPPPREDYQSKMNQRSRAINTGPQAWARRDTMKSGRKVSGGFGMHMLQRMGWSPGEGLGKNREGVTEPLAIDVKIDKKGLASTDDVKPVTKGARGNVDKLNSAAGKPPVTALLELCVQRKWERPIFQLVLDEGPIHSKHYIFRVSVHGVDYQPHFSSNNKKIAKSNAAALCLEALGLLPPATQYVPQSADPTQFQQTSSSATAYNKFPQGSSSATPYSQFQQASSSATPYNQFQHPTSATAYSQQPIAIQPTAYNQHYRYAGYESCFVRH